MKSTVVSEMNDLHTNRCAWHWITGHITSQTIR